MARTLTTPGPLDTLEESFDLLQRTPANAWLRYLAGAAPLVVALIYAWNQVTSPLATSLLLVALLTWFYYSRQQFTRELHSLLAVGPAPASASAPPDTMVAVNHAALWAACFQGAKLLVMPLTLLSILPLAVVTAFYRSLNVYAAQGLSPREAIAKSRHAAFAWQRENWLILGILTLLAIVVLINIAIAIISAPFLLKMFTGYENVSTERSSGAAVPIILVLAWLCFDPLLQAVYTVRAFYFEGLRTGEDLLVRLHRLAPILLLLACLVPHASAIEPPKAAALNHAIDQVLQSPAYDWRLPPADIDENQHDWFIDTVDRTVAVFRKVWKAISDLWSDLWDWFRKVFSPTQAILEKNQNRKPSGVRPIFYIIGVLILALALVLLWKNWPRKTTQDPIVPTPGPIDITNEDLLPSDLPEDEWLAMAEKYAASGDLRLALRALYLGTLAILGHRGLITIHRAKSNRDYERELLRRSRDNSLSQIFGFNIRAFERSWYGFHEVTPGDVQAFRENLVRMKA